MPSASPPHDSSFTSARTSPTHPSSPAVDLSVHGTLHAHGNLHEAHNVSYSIGLVGEYLLHVRLHAAGVQLPGSPFRLVVTPGHAHAQATILPEQSIVGTVGMDAKSGCGVRRPAKRLKLPSLHFAFT